MGDKVIIITGVSSGIGKAFVSKALNNISKGTVVVGIGRKNLANFKHHQYLFIRADLTKPDSLERAFEQIMKTFGRIDILINNAGFAYRSTIQDLEIREIKEQFEVSLFGPIHLIQLVLPTMQQQNSGHIINVSTVGSIVSTPTLGYYAAAKAGMDKLSDILEQEVNPFNIKVSTLIPGAVKTDFGKNIRLSINYPSSKYLLLYEEWQKRFKYFFKNKNSAEEVADCLWYLTINPSRSKFVNIRDQVMSLLKKTLPHFIFQYLFLNYFYKYES